MANGVNSLSVIGNLAKDGELDYVGENSTPKASSRIVTTTGPCDHEHTEGFNLVLWGKRAKKLAEY